MRCRNSSRYENDKATYQAARGIWIQNWVARFGDAAVAWIEIPDERVNHVDNPTGHSVLCFSTFHSAYNGVFCFVPFEAAANNLTGRPRRHSVEGTVNHVGVTVIRSARAAFR